MNITPEQLLAILPEARSKVHVFCGPLNEAMARVGIDTAHEIATFLCEVGHESQHLQRLEENLNYSADALRWTWPKRFDAAIAAEYARHPERIADRAYANRYENGAEDSGDGWRYRGRGLIQLTFRMNYRKCGDWLGLDLVGQPTLLLDPVHAADSAAWFWKVNGLDTEDDDEDVSRETRIINGGAMGLAERQAIFDRALKEIS